MERYEKTLECLVNRHNRLSELTLAALAVEDENAIDVFIQEAIVCARTIEELLSEIPREVLREWEKTVPFLSGVPDDYC